MKGHCVLEVVANVNGCRVAICAVDFFDVSTSAVVIDFIDGICGIVFAVTSIGMIFLVIHGFVSAGVVQKFCVHQGGHIGVYFGAVNILFITVLIEAYIITGKHYFNAFNVV